MDGRIFQSLKFLNREFEFRIAKFLLFRILQSKVMYLYVTNKTVVSLRMNHCLLMNSL